MARPNKTNEKRAELLPIVAHAFSELGYRKATTKALAARCGVQENILYRLWADKKAMFVASIDYLFDATMTRWQGMIDDASADPDGPTASERILAYDAAHRGDSGFYRITFAALSETDDADVRGALKRMYGKFTKVIEAQIASGHLRPNDRLDPVRTVADELGLAPNTVAAAYRALGERGLVNGEGRRGTFVASRPPIAMPIDERIPDGLIDLSSGNPDPGLLPELGSALASISSRHITYG